MARATGLEPATSGVTGLSGSPKKPSNSRVVPTEGAKSAKSAAPCTILESEQPRSLADPRHRDLADSILSDMNALGVRPTPLAILSAATDAGLDSEAE
jgi:hypothetical protein